MSVKSKVEIHEEFIERELSGYWNTKQHVFEGWSLALGSNERFDIQFTECDGETGFSTVTYPVPGVGELRKNFEI